jgi:hypothetical protein
VAEDDNDADDGGPIPAGDATELPLDLLPPADRA